MSTEAGPVAREAIPREVWILIAAAFVIAVGFGLIVPVLPTFAASFNVGATLSAVIVSSFAFFRLIFAPTGGRLVARFGERPIYLIGLLIVAASSAASAFAQTYWQLLVFRSVGGIGSTMFSVSALALIVRVSPPGIRARVASAYATAFLIGGITGPILGGFLGAYGLRVPFVAYAVFLVIAAAIVALNLRGEKLGAGKEAREGRPAFTVREALRDSAYRAGLLSSLSNGWANWGVRNAILPLFVTAAISRDPRITGIALAVFAAGNAGAMLLAGRLSDRIGRRPLIIAGLAVSGLAMAVTGLVGTVPLLMAVSAVAGFGSGIFNPALQASVADVIGNQRNGGPALAFFQMATDAGAIVGPLIAGVLVDAGSFGGAFGLSGALTLIAILPWLRARETNPAKG